MRRVKTIAYVMAYTALLGAGTVNNIEAQTESDGANNSSEAYRLVAECGTESTDREKEICKEISATTGYEVGEGVSIWFKGDSADIESQLESVRRDSETRE